MGIGRLLHHLNNKTLVLVQTALPDVQYYRIADALQEVDFKIVSQSQGLYLNAKRGAACRLYNEFLRWPVADTITNEVRIRVCPYLAEDTALVSSLLRVCVLYLCSTHSNLDFQKDKRGHRQQC